MSLFEKRSLGVAVIAVATSFATLPAMSQVQLDFWSEFSASPGLESITAIVEAFNEANPDIVVTHTGFENTPYETALKTSFAGGSPADIVQVNAGGAMFQYAEAGQLLDLSDFIAESGVTVRPGLDTFYKLGGRAWGIPLVLNIGNLLYFNADMLAEQGIDPQSLNTWNGLLEAAETFKQAGIAPIAFGNQEGWPGNHLHNHLLLRLFGYEDYVSVWFRTLDPTAAGEARFTDQEETVSWEMFKELQDRGYFTAGYLADNYPAAYRLFLNEEAPIFIMGSWFLANIQSIAPDMNFGVIPFPEVEGYPGKQTDLVTAGLVVSITESSEHPEEAKRFLEYLMSEPVQRQWAEETVGLTPYVYDTSNWDYSDEFKRIAELLANSTAAVPFGDMLEDQACNVPWTWQASQGILTGDITPEEVGQGHEDCVTDLMSTKFGI
ncbi:MAG: extracellular solute-binding protein [Planctomycetales bacterium]|nr:extracellular solute-binding protein [Planctomycetales bacterium]MCC0022848.1 extracellular solute-binding protein [Hyphomicrobiaceae bacterium]